jgi:hypothetical protein
MAKKAKAAMVVVGVGAVGSAPAGLKANARPVAKASSHPPWKALAMQPRRF